MTDINKTFYHILVIQTAFIGDVVLATALLEKLHQFYPTASIDILVRKGNEELFIEHPFLNKVLIWDKKEDKISNLFKIITEVRSSKYDIVVNCHRYLSSGLMTVFSGAKYTVGFDKNPLSLFFSKSVKHSFEGIHEIARNQLLIQDITDEVPKKPCIYPAAMNLAGFGNPSGKFITISPCSVWFTKQYPLEKWVEFINVVPSQFDIVLLGAHGDKMVCESIKKSVNEPSRICILAGRLSLLQSASLMQQSEMNFVNDSAPMHLSSAVNAPTCAIYCSTLPSFGFGPLSSLSFVIETKKELKCKPCGIHGVKSCPKQHFDCAKTIDTSELLQALNAVA